MLRDKNNTITEAFENKVEILHHHYPTKPSLNLKYISRLPSLQYFHLDYASGIAFLIKIKIQLPQLHFLKENLKTI